MPSRPGAVTFRALLLPDEAVAQTPCRPDRSEASGHAAELPRLRPRPGTTVAAEPARLAARRPLRLVRARRRRGDGPSGVLRLLPPRRPRSRRPRPADDGRAPALRLRARRTVIAAGRARPPRGHR